MSDFAEDFRKEIEAEYDAVVNDRKDGLGIARAQGLSALVSWAQRRLIYDLRCALDTSNPGDIPRACARGALTFLMIRDAYMAFDLMLRDAYDGPDGEREERIAAAVKTHSRFLRNVELPDPGFQTQIMELVDAAGWFVINVSMHGHSVRIKPLKADAKKWQTFEGATIVAAIGDAHAVLVEAKRLERATDPVGQS